MKYYLLSKSSCAFLRGGEEDKGKNRHTSTRLPFTDHHHMDFLHLPDTLKLNSKLFQLWGCSLRLVTAQESAQ